jgi:hypothetical protein
MKRREFLQSTAGVASVALTGLTISPYGADSAFSADAATPTAPASAPITPNASPEVQVVLKFIQDEPDFGRQVMACQHGGQARVDYVVNTTGKYPAIWGTDLIFKRSDNSMPKVFDAEHTMISIGEV